MGLQIKLFPTQDLLTFNGRYGRNGSLGQPVQLARLLPGWIEPFKEVSLQLSRFTCLPAASKKLQIYLPFRQQLIGRSVGCEAVGTELASQVDPILAVEIAQ